MLGNGFSKIKVAWTSFIVAYGSMSYTVSMNFEWDEIKSDACFAELGFDFAYVTRAFVDPNRFIRKDIRWNYGEERYQLLGSIGQRAGLAALD